MIYACRLTSQQTLHTSVEVHSGRFYRTVARPLTKVQARPRPLSPSRGFPRFTSSKLTVTSFASFLGFVFLSAQQVFPASQCSQGSNGLKTTKKSTTKYTVEFISGPLLVSVNAAARSKERGWSLRASSLPTRAATDNRSALVQSTTFF